jgi:hypothetical protein
MKIIYVFLVLLYSCKYYPAAYYSSPVNSLTNTYHTIPLQSDSSRSAYYINAAISSGSANDRAHDKVFSFQTSFSASNNFKNFQMYYGGGLVLGQYKFNHYAGDYHSDIIDFQALDQYAGNYFFGAVGFNAGMDVVVPFPLGGDWRLLGVETSLYKDFGNYFSVRKQLPDTAATFIARGNSLATIGFYSEIVDKTKYGSFGVKCSAGWMLGKDYHYVGGIGNYGYLNFTLAPTIRRWTPYLQANFATKAASAMAGVNYRIGK